MSATASPPQNPGQVSYTVEWLLELLERNKIIDTATRKTVEVGQREQRTRVIKQVLGSGDLPAGAHYSVSPAELVASFKLADRRGGDLDEDKLAQIIAAKAQFLYKKVDPLELDMGLITRTLSRPFALRHVVLPLAEANGELTIAVDNPFDIEVVENLRRIYPGKLKRVVASKRDILKSITEIYGFRKSVESAAKESGTSVSGDFEQLVRLRNVGDIGESDQPVVNAVDFLFRYAFDQRASDIHIEPRKNDSQVRLRIDGVLHNVHTIPKRVHPAIASRLKSIARMDIAEKRRPQDGRIKTVLADKEVELRVSCIPVAFGEKIVVRIFDPGVLLQEFPDLGFEQGDQATFERWIAEPHGLVLITGPTGSGKTTTLYTTLKRLAGDDVNVTTVEDPIEMVTDAFNQMQAQPKIGVDFATAMRSILRQDPDIIMVGEIRDSDTAQMAVEAALTGHLVFSTLHTNDTVGAVTRLVDMGIEPFLISSTLVGVMAQRLLRRICPQCKVTSELSGDEMLILGIPESERAAYAGVCKGRGCVHCRGTGYYGRVGIFEILSITRELTSALQAGLGEEELRAKAVKAGMRPLRVSALDRLRNGITTFDELVRVTGIGVRV
ncbi:MAG: type II/IV secretion system protein [Clostridia bacterium]|nr:type II/IV secretion system protein [Deltaproteobacteria bacterium]